jgi:hypothetical protein
MKQTLHHGDITPTTELATDLTFDAYQLKAGRGVKATTGQSGSFDTGHDGVEALGFSDIEHRGEQQAPNATTMSGATDVHRVLDTGAVSGSILIGRQRCEPEHDALAVFEVLGYKGTERAGSGRQPSLLVGLTSRDEIKGRRCMKHFVVVDGANGLSVVKGGWAHSHHHTTYCSSNPLGRTGQLLAILYRLDRGIAAPALLAQ